MIKKILGISLISAMLLLSGCGEDGGVSQLETQQMLDKGDFTGVISKLEPTASTDSDHLALAAAYMGKAGLALPSLIEIIINSGDSTNNAFGTFIQNVGAKKSSTALNDLEKSSGYYKKVIGEKCKESLTPNSNVILTDSQKDVCLFLGLSQTLKAATTITYIADDVSGFGDANAAQDPKLKTSSCAMQYAVNGAEGNDCSVTPNANVHFLQSGNTYESIIVTDTISSKSFEYLLSGDSAPKKTIITNGFCSHQDFSTRISDKNVSKGYVAATFHVCPLTENNTTADITTTEVLVEALNEGTDSIGVATGADMQQSSDEFKCEVLSGNYNNNNCDKALTEDITEQQIIDYLNSNN